MSTIPPSRHVNNYSRKTACLTSVPRAFSHVFADAPQLPIVKRSQIRYYCGIGATKRQMAKTTTVGIGEAHVPQSSLRILTKAAFYNCRIALGGTSIGYRQTSALILTYVCRYDCRGFIRKPCIDFVAGVLQMTQEDTTQKMCITKSAVSRWENDATSAVPPCRIWQSTSAKTQKQSSCNHATV